MKDNPKILIGTLYSGENELEDCINAVEKQNYKNWEHKVFKNLPNKEAHDTLYRFFMDRAGEFDLFIKLDADMVFQDERALDEIVKIFQGSEDLDHLVTAVWDFFSESLIMGLHIFSNRVWWEVNEERVFVDPDPFREGEKIALWEAPAPFVLHNPNPDPLQAYSFGVHRMSKAIQSDRRTINRSQTKVQWGLIEKVWTHYKKNQDPRLGLAIIGADEVLSKKSDLRAYKNLTPEYISAKLKSLEDAKFVKKLHWRWDHKLYRNFRFYKTIIGRLFLFRLKRKTRHLLELLGFK